MRMATNGTTEVTAAKRFQPSGSRLACYRSIEPMPAAATIMMLPNRR